MHQLTKRLWAPWRALRVAAGGAGLLLVSGGAAFADDSARLTDATAWKAWDFTPDIVIATALVVAIYVAGMLRRRDAATPVPMSRHALFFGGVAAVFISLQSPIDAIADRLFLVHQIQHLLLRMVGPMLLALSWPEGLLTAGLPRGVRRTVLAPIASNGAVRTVFAVLGQPLVATILFIAALYVWQVPAYQDYALLHEGVHYVMHVTMLAAGLLFWWRIFDRRPPKSVLDFDDDNQPWWRSLGRSSPHGLRYGVRLMMLWIVTLSNILLGAATALKSVELYPAYDIAGRLFGFSPVTDEQIGGFIIWMPSSMMCIIAVLLVLSMLAENERRLAARRRAQPNSNFAALLVPTTGAELVALARPKNRSMALGFSAFVLSVFTVVLLIGVVDFATRNGGVAGLERGRLTRVAHSHLVFPPGWFDDQAGACGTDCAASTRAEAPLKASTQG